jgi:hypothetical protein
MVSSMVCFVGATPSGRRKSGDAPEAQKQANEASTLQKRDMKISYWQVGDLPRISN